MSKLRKIICSFLGHDKNYVGEPIFHDIDRLIEQDFDCRRCGIKATLLLPYHPIR